MGVRYPTAKNGEPFYVRRGKEILKLSCCDCGLVHFMDIELNRKKMFKIIMWRDNRATGQRRRIEHKMIKS